MNSDDISHFSTIPASFAIKSNVYFITHQYLIINNSQSQRALSVSVGTVLWIYFASRRNCGLLPTGAVFVCIRHLNDYTCKCIVIFAKKCMQKNILILLLDNEKFYLQFLGKIFKNYMRF